MDIVLTDSLGNIGKPLPQTLGQKGHSITVISGSPDRKEGIESLGAKAAIGTMQDVNFLMQTFDSAIQEGLLSGTKANVLFEVYGQDDEFSLSSAADVPLQWLHNPHPKRGSRLADVAKNMLPPAAAKGHPYINSH